MCRKGTSHADVSAVAVRVGCVICKIERQGCAGDGAGATRGLCSGAKEATWETGRRTGAAGGQISGGLLGHCKDLGFYSKWGRK